MLHLKHLILEEKDKVAKYIWGEMSISHFFVLLRFCLIITDLLSSLILLCQRDNINLGLIGDSIKLTVKKLKDYMLYDEREDINDIISKDFIKIIPEIKKYKQKIGLF